MGKGDQTTGRGKLNRGSFGNTRKRKKKTKYEHKKAAAKK
ncbi:MAG: 30S ribosomal protein THX [Bdellovibrionales bacterium]|nr:30S ribosomal protein THX [Bdellovibrionales bacterium]